MLSGPSELRFGVYTCHLSVHQQRQQDAVINIQRVFRGWRQRMYERVNALRYDLERRKQRAVAKAWKRARQIVETEVSACTICVCPNRTVLYPCSIVWCCGSTDALSCVPVAPMHCLVSQ